MTKREQTGLLIGGAILTVAAIIFGPKIVKGITAMGAKQTKPAVSVKRESAHDISQAVIGMDGRKAVDMVIAAGYGHREIQHGSGWTKEMNPNRISMLMGPRPPCLQGAYCPKPKVARAWVG